MGPRAMMLTLGAPPLAALVALAWLAPPTLAPLCVTAAALAALATLWIGATRLAFEQRALIARLADARREIETQGAGLVAARADAERATAAKRTFLATAGHELRTPMTAIIGMTRLALATDLSPRQRDYLNRADRAAHMLLAQINDILDDVRADSGDVSLTRVGFRIDDVLDAVLARASLAVGEKDLQVRLERDPAIPAVLLGDPRRLEQVLGALADNAVKFADHGEVTIGGNLVALTADQAEIICEVRGTGGSAAADLFEVFTQGDDGLTRRHGGAGLGLGLCRRLVERMGGQLRLECLPGFGSRFRVQLGFGVEGGAAALAAWAVTDTGPSAQTAAAALVVDLGAARRRCGTEQRLRRLLRRFATDHAGFVDAYRRLYGTGDRFGAAQLARGLTSAAAGLGARSLAASAARLALMRRMDDAPGALLEQVAQDLAAAIAAVDVVLKQPTPLPVGDRERRALPSAGSRVVPRYGTWPALRPGGQPPAAPAGADGGAASGADLTVALQQLAGLLAEFDAAAINAFERLRPTLIRLGQTRPLEGLQRDIHGFDFSSALAGLYEFARMIGVDLAGPRSRERPDAQAQMAQRRQ